jgi:glycosyltransferase involved in cell wall biosynthesis
VPPTFSLVVAVRNAAATIERCLESVAAQEEVGEALAGEALAGQALAGQGPAAGQALAGQGPAAGHGRPGVELLVIDGASTDGTQAVIERCSERHPGLITHFESKPDRGIYHAWNKALDHVTGEWICFLGADDELAGPDILARAAPMLAGGRGRFRVVYGRLEVVAADGSVVRRLGEPWETIRGRFRQRMELPHPATFQHRSLFEAVGRFDESFRISGDYELLLRELLEHDALFIDLLLVRMGAGGLSDRPSSVGTLIRETHRARYMHGLVGTPAWRTPRVLRSLAYHRLARTLGPRAAEAAADAWHALTRTPRAGRGA